MSTLIEKLKIVQKLFGRLGTLQGTTDFLTPGTAKATANTSLTMGCYQ